METNDKIFSFNQPTAVITAEFNDNALYIGP